jgi:hypothetical protein
VHEARLRNGLFALTQSGLMSCLLSALGQLHAHGLANWDTTTWVHSWMLSWLVAWPAALVFAVAAQGVVIGLLGPPRE